MKLKDTQIEYQRRKVVKGVQFKYPNIEAERARFHLSQDALVSKLGVERKSYYNWLTQGNIPTSVLIQMADLFDCSIDYLLGRTRNPMVN